MENQKFWAIVELFGHTKLAGQVSPSELADFILVEIPECEPVPAWSKMISPKAVYAITPCTEEDAIQTANQLKAMPIDQWSSRQLAESLLNKMVEDGKVKRLKEDGEADQDDCDEIHGEW